MAHKSASGSALAAALLRTAPVPIFCTDEQSRISEANDAALLVLGDVPDACWAATTARLKTPTFPEIWQALREAPHSPVQIRGILANDDQTSFVCNMSIPEPFKVATCVLFESPLFDAVTQVSQALASEDRLEPILELIAEQARRLCKGHRAYLKLYDKASEKLVFRALSAADPNEEFPERESPVTRGLTGAAFTARQVINCGNVKEDPRYNHTLFHDTESELVAPLVFEDRRRPRTSAELCLGVIVVHSRKKNAFSIEAQHRLTLLASHATLAVRGFETRGFIQTTYTELLRTVRSTQDSRYAASLLHDASNLVRDINHILETLSSELSTRSFSGRLNAGLEKDRQSLTAMYSLMKSLLHKLEPGRADLPEAEVSDVIAVAHEIHRALLPREHGLELNVEVERPDGHDDLDEDSEGPLYVARISPGGLRIVLFNLVNNSIRAMRNKEKDGSVRIVVSESPSRNDFVRIQVIDDGPGLKRTVREALQQSTQTTATPGGLGLGLMTVREIVDAAGGSIEIDGRLGSGTAIRIDLPTI